MRRFATPSRATSTVGEWSRVAATAAATQRLFKL
jgi:hypothetical protein